MNFEEQIYKQVVFSQETFGPGSRTKGVIDHIRKELVEVENSKGSSDEWVDVALLGLDGLARALKTERKLNDADTASAVVAKIVEKFQINTKREWPDYRTASQDSAIEHRR